MWKLLDLATFYEQDAGHVGTFEEQLCMQVFARVVHKDIEADGKVNA